MNIKQFIGIIVAVLGVILIGYGIYSIREVSAAKKEIHKIADSKNPTVRHMGKQMQDMMGVRKNPNNWVVVFGGILVIFGIGCVLFFREHHNRRGH